MKLSDVRFFFPLGDKNGIDFDPVHSPMASVLVVAVVAFLWSAADRAG